MTLIPTTRSFGKFSKKPGAHSAREEKEPRNPDLKGPPQKKLTLNEGLAELLNHWERRTGGKQLHQKKDNSTVTKIWTKRGPPAKKTSRCSRGGLPEEKQGGKKELEHYTKQP